MKVCTDGCIQGAYAAKVLLKRTENYTNMLDVGAGTGLLSLMLAQNHPLSHICAVEINAAACSQAFHNFQHSPWSDRLEILHRDVRTYFPDKRYEFIISNPPFYEKDLRTGHVDKDQAKHAVDLNYSELLDCFDLCLTETGIFCVMLPNHLFSIFAEKAMKMGFLPERYLRIRQSPHDDYFRCIGFFGRDRKSVV